MAAAEKGHEAVVQMLLDEGAQVDLQNKVPSHHDNKTF